jgi:hypothetical protein
MPERAQCIELQQLLLAQLGDVLGMKKKFDSAV